MKYYFQKDIHEIKVDFIKYLEHNLICTIFSNFICSGNLQLNSYFLLSFVSVQFNSLWSVFVYFYFLLYYLCFLLKTDILILLLLCRGILNSSVVAPGIHTFMGNFVTRQHISQMFQFTQGYKRCQEHFLLKGIEGKLWWYFFSKLKNDGKKHILFRYAHHPPLLFSRVGVFSQAFRVFKGSKNNQSF